MDRPTFLTAVISDTHGLLRPEILRLLAGCDHILHAGDVGKAGILAALQQIAPTTAVRGNVDTGAWAEALPSSVLVDLAGLPICMLHNLAELEIQPAAAGVRVVVSGHTHRALIEERAGVLYLNPGSAGPRRFGMPVSMARLRIAAGRVEPELIELPLD